MRAIFLLGVICLLLGDLFSSGQFVSGNARWGGPFRKMFPVFDEDEFVEKLANSGVDPGPPLFLTPLLNAGKVEVAREAARVNLGATEDVISYSGYLTVGNQACGSNLFFWFFPAMHIYHTAPVMLWLQGGPGGSSLFGLFNELGPFRINQSFHLNHRPTSWTLTHSVLFVDNPVGTGYSFTGQESCYASNEDDVASDLYDALLQFFTMFPYLRQNEFYVAGESYAGKYVPAISYKIHKEQSKTPKPKELINFKGLAIGDGLCDPLTMTGYGDFLYTIGLIDEINRDSFNAVSARLVKLINDKKWTQAFQVFDNLLNGDLSGHPSFFTNATSFKYYFNYLHATQPEDMSYYNYYVSLPDVRRAIHVGSSKWNDGRKVEQQLLSDIMQSVKPWIQELLEHYKVLIYNGQLDVIIAWPLTENFLTSMKWSGSEQYYNQTRTAWYVGNDLAGYAKTVKNFTQVLVRNSGHMVPYDQPKWAFDMINRFTSGKSFDSKRRAAST